MTTFIASPAASPARTRRRARALRIALWAARILLAIQFALAGVLKLSADPSMVAMFDTIGAGEWLRLIVGACEVLAAIGLLVPRTARAAAAGVTALMVGAAGTNALVLHTSPALPLVLGVIAAVVAVALGKANAR